MGGNQCRFANIQKSNVVSADFTGAMLAKAMMWRCDCRHAIFHKADLIEISQILTILTEDAPAQPIAKNRPRRSRRSSHRSSESSDSGGRGLVHGGAVIAAEEACMAGPSLDDIGDEEPEMMPNAGLLSYAQVKSAMDVFLGRLSRCAQAEDGWPKGKAQFEIVMACTRQLQSVQVSSNQGLADSLLGCTKDLLRLHHLPCT
ncbi:MAG: pentapeptide repeat-containing protein [Myxococcota bacterium]